MAKVKHYCEGCALHEPTTVPAVGTFKFPDGYIATGCREHLDQWAKSVPHIFGPVYGGKVGSKGGGASADMAEQLKSKAGRDRMRIARWLAEFGAHGAEDVAQGLSLDADYVSPRLSELVTLGLAEKGPRTAVTRRGNPAHVYQLTDAGLSVANRKAAA